MTTAMAVVVDVSVVLALGLLACCVLRRRPASLRHLILAASLAAGATAPILEATLPHWEMAVRSITVQAPTPELSSASAAAPFVPSPAIERSSATGFSWMAILVTIWALGSLFVFAGLIAGLVRLRSMTRQCLPVRSSAWRERADALAPRSVRLQADQAAPRSVRLQADQQRSLTRQVMILESPDRALLLTWGFFRPRIIVPPGAGAWTADRIDVVLAHELAHIARGDWALQIAAEIIRAVYWFNPLVWIVCRRLRDESEQACDDIVLRRGVDAAEYASHLLAVARDVLAVDRGWASAAAVANRSTLEHRISAMLNHSRTRRPLTALAGALTVMTLLAITVPVAAVTLTERIVQTTTASAVPHDVALVTPASSPAVAAARAVTASALTTIATSTRRLDTPRATESPVPSASPEPPAPPAQQKPATLSGVLRDATGAVVPGVTVTVTDTATGMRHSTTTDAIGAFTIRNLPPSTYEFRASLPGFASIADVVTLADGADVQRRWEMRVGGVTETIVVTCPAGAAALPASAGVLAFENRRAPTSLFAQQAPVRVGGSIAAPRQNKRVQPRCPGIQPPADGIVVILEATIAVDGQTKDVRSLRPVPGQQGFPSAFVDAAVEAIRQWEFTPTRLNNVPVPVIVTVTVSYRRE